MNLPLNDVATFDLITSIAGAATNADSAPSWEVFEDANDTAIRSGSFTQRTSKTGNYRASETLSAANGYDVGKWYNVIASAVLGGITGKTLVLQFRVVIAEVVAGQPGVDVRSLNSTALNGNGSTTPWGP